MSGLIRTRASKGPRPRPTRYSRNADSVISNPLTAFDWYGAAWADDPLWTPPADGGAVSSWRNGGTLRQSGAYLDASAGLVLPGTSGNYASVPDETALDITGDFEMEAWLKPVFGTIQFIASKNLTAYEFYLNSANELILVTASAGVTSTAALNTVISSGQRVGVKVTFRASDNRVQFFTNTGAGWVQLGADRTAVGGPAANTFGLRIGYRNGGGTYPFNGTIENFTLRNGIDGAAVLDVDFTEPADDTTSFVCDTGQTVTVSSTFAFNQSTGASQPTYRASVAALGNRPAIDFDGTDDRLEITSGVSLDQPFSMVTISAYDALTTARVLVGLQSVSNARRFGTDATPNWATNLGTALVGGTPAINTAYMARAYANGASSAISVNGTSVASGDTNTGSVDQLILGAGRTAPSTYAFHLDGKVAFVGIIAGDITTHPNWPAFKRWAAAHYGITVAG